MFIGINPFVGLVCACLCFLQASTNNQNLFTKLAFILLYQNCMEVLVDRAIPMSDVTLTTQVHKVSCKVVLLDDDLIRTWSPSCKSMQLFNLRNDFFQ